MKEYFHKLYQYNAWANRRVLGALERQNVTDAKILRVFGHLVSAQIIWYCRIKDLPKSELKLWGDRSLSELRPLVEEGEKCWLEFIDEEDSFDRTLKYHNYVGNYFETNLRDLMTHLVNHGTYHRGQIALLLREGSFEPVNTDFVSYDRVITGQLEEKNVPI